MQENLKVRPIISIVLSKVKIYIILVMRYTIIIAGLLLCFACKNQSSDKGKSEESKSNSEQNDPKESSESEGGKSADENPMQELAGTWKQAPNGNVEVTGKNP